MAVVGVEERSKRWLPRWIWKPRGVSRYMPHPKVGDAANMFWFNRPQLLLTLLQVRGCGGEVLGGVGGEGGMVAWQ